jgi:hypothetical protein
MLESQTPTPLPPPPRPIDPRPGLNGTTGLWIQRILLLPHTLIGIGATLACLWYVFTFLFSVTTTATVLSTSVTPTSKSPIHRITYRYQVGNQTIEQTEIVTKDLFDELKPKSHQLEPQPTPITIRHLDFLFIHHSHIPSPGPFPWGRMACVVPFVTVWLIGWNAIVFLFVRKLWILPLRTRHLLQHGLATTGTITRKRRTETRNPDFYLAFTFPDPTTQSPREVEINCVEDLWNTTKLHDPVTVLYDPKNPARATIYEFAPYQLKSPSLN